MPADVDGVRVHVDVHEVVNDLALDVVLHSVDQEPATHINDLNEGQVPVEQREEEKDKPDANIYISAERGKLSKDKKRYSVCVV